MAISVNEMEVNDSIINGTPLPTGTESQSQTEQHNETITWETGPASGGQQTQAQTTTPTNQTQTTPPENQTQTKTPENQPQTKTPENQPQTTSSENQTTTPKGTTPQTSQPTAVGGDGTVPKSVLDDLARQTNTNTQTTPTNGTEQKTTVSSNIPLNATLTFANAITLIVLSVILTLIGGIIPARAASKKDPVIALRTE